MYNSLWTTEKLAGRSACISLEKGELQMKEGMRRSMMQESARRLQGQWLHVKESKRVKEAESNSWLCSATIVTICGFKR